MNRAAANLCQPVASVTEVPRLMSSWNSLGLCVNALTATKISVDYIYCEGSLVRRVTSLNLRMALMHVHMKKAFRCFLILKVNHHIGVGVRVSVMVRVGLWLGPVTLQTSDP